MPFIKSRVNGLSIAIPNDARNVIHRYAVHGGGNELVFEPPKRSAYEASRKAEGTGGVSLGGQATPDAPESDEAVTLTVGVVEDDDEPEAKEPKAKKPRKRRASPAKSDEDIL